MFKRVELKNFRQHTDLAVDFENGLVALRGANEAGKTTLLEAMAYAMFGASALRDTLAETVTWGQKESTLKVRVWFVINGVEYVVSRGKSGAEIKSGDQILATGQTEVKKYCETLIGATADTARNMMMANQQALRGALEKGPSAAIELIETLANFSLIDKIVGLVQTHLPCGTTVAVEARVTMLEEQVKVPLQDDTGPLEQEVLAAQKVQADATKVYDTAKAAYDKAQPKALKAQELVDQLQRANVTAGNKAALLTQAEQTVAAIKPVPGPTAEAIAELRKQVEDAGRMSRAAQAYAALAKLPEPAWEGSLASLQEERVKVSKTLEDHRTKRTDQQRKLAGFQAQIITETACGLCGKDLSNVPEVVTKNAKLQTQIDDATALIGVLDVAIAEALDIHATYAAVLDDHMKCQRAFQQYAEFIALDEGFVPHRWTWTGPDTTIGTSAVGPAQALQQAEAQAQAYQRDQGRLAQAQAALEAASQAHTEANTALAALEKQVARENPQAVLTTAAQATTKMYEAEQALQDASRAHETALQALNAGRAVLAERRKARDGLEASLAEAKNELQSMQFNNGLIQALRMARPDISNELWGIVSGSVSQFFSDIRGESSMFSREDNGFKVNGQSISGLSGSTLDALGLAIRMSLTSTFLPNASFLTLDEPAAAADMEREMNMLGVVASSGFGQVILVTHSDLADSFASQVIRL